MVFSSCLDKKSTFITVHTLCNRVIKVPQSKIHTVDGLKDELCKKSCVFPEHVALVSDGSYVEDNSDTPFYLQLLKPLYAYVKASSDFAVVVSVKHAGSAGTTPVICALNSTVRDIKKKLLVDKVTDIRVFEQRAILSGHVMKDECLLGDYLLLTKSPKSIKNKPHAAACTIILSKTVSLRREIDIVLSMPNAQTLSFSFPCGEMMYFAKLILFNQYGVPNDVPYVFKYQKSVILMDNDTLFDSGLVAQNTTSVPLTFVATYTLHPPSSSHLVHQDISTITQQELSLIPSGMSLVSFCSDSSSYAGETTNDVGMPGPAISGRDNKSGGLLFKGMKKGFLSAGSIAKKSSLSIRHPAATASAVTASASKNIWTDSEIPSEADLRGKRIDRVGGVHASAKRKKADTADTPVRFANTCPRKEFLESQTPLQPQPLPQQHSPTMHILLHNKETETPSKDTNSKRSFPSHGEKAVNKKECKSNLTGSSKKSRVPSRNTTAAPSYNISYTQETKQENGMSVITKSVMADQCTHIIVNIHFPHSKMKDLDLDVTSKKIKVSSKFHTLVTPLPVRVQCGRVKAKFSSKKEVLTVTLPIDVADT